MFKHTLVLSINKDSTETIAETYFQVNLFGKQLKLFKRRTKATIKQKEHKSTDDYISISIPKYGDVPTVTLKGKDVCETDEAIECVKFVWVTGKRVDPFIRTPYLDVNLLHGKDDGEYSRRSKVIGSEEEAEYQRLTAKLSKEGVEHVMIKSLVGINILERDRDVSYHEDDELELRAEVSD